MGRIGIEIFGDVLCGLLFLLLYIYRPKKGKNGTHAHKIVPVFMRASVLFSSRRASIVLWLLNNTREAREKKTFLLHF